jgi:site-specific DNA-methyltransferase (adenine-specific)
MISQGKGGANTQSGLRFEKQMKDVWQLPSIAVWEKKCGKHPTQKPLKLLSRIILASTIEDQWILDPFTGSSTTGVASKLLNRRFVGIDKELDYLNISLSRLKEIENKETFNLYLSASRQPTFNFPNGT